MVLVIWTSSTLNSYLSLISNNVWAIISLRDHQKKTFVTLNRFCALSNMDKTKLNGILNGQNQAGWNHKQN